MWMPAKLRHRLLLLWLASVAVTVLVVGASFHFLLTDLHERQSRAEIGRAFATMAARLAEVETRLERSATLLAARPDLVAVLHLVSDYQDPTRYQPYLFDVEKQALAAELAEYGRAARLDFIGAYDRAGNLSAFHAGEAAGFESFQGGRAVFLAPQRQQPVEPPAYLRIPPSFGDRVEHVAMDGTLLLRRVVPVTRDGDGAREGAVVVGQALDQALRDDGVQRAGLRFVLVTGRAGHATAFGVDLSEMAAALPLLGQGDPVNERSWRLPHPDVFLGAMRLPLAGGGWAFLVLAADKSELEAGLGAFQRAAAAGSAAIALVLLPLGLYVLRRTISTPVERLTRAVRAVREGRFEAVAWGGGSGELAELAEAVDAMAGTIRARARDLEGTVDELSRSNAELQQFAHIAAHDLNEPVRLVVSYAQLLERRLGPRLDAEEREFMDYLTAAARRMHALVGDILAHAQAGMRELAFEPVEVDALVAAVLDTLRPSIEAAGAHVEVRPLPRVVASASQLQQVFQNLVGNALKFTAPRQAPVIRIEAEARPGEWLFTVSDNGIGIEPQYQERIFQVFQRLHAQDRYPGTGIGLAICKRVVERHGGRIWVDSAPGRGSRFRFTLPAEPGPDSARHARALQRA